MCKCIEQMWVWDSMRDPPSFRVIIQEFHSYNDFIRNPVRSMSNIKRKRYIKLNGSSGIITYPYMCSIPARCHLSSTDSHSKFLREFYLKVYIRLTDLSATSSVRIHCSRVSWRRRRKGEYRQFDMRQVLEMFPRWYTKLWRESNLPMENLSLIPPSPVPQI